VHPRILLGSLGKPTIHTRGLPEIDEALYTSAEHINALSFVSLAHTHTLSLSPSRTLSGAGRFLIEKHSIGVCPSLRIARLATLRLSNPSNPALRTEGKCARIVGNPLPLPSGCEPHDAHRKILLYSQPTRLNPLNHRVGNPRPLPLGCEKPNVFISHALLKSCHVPKP